MRLSKFWEYGIGIVSGSFCWTLLQVCRVPEKAGGEGCVHGVPFRGSRKGSLTCALAFG